MDKSAYSRKMNREEKKTNTVSFQSTNKESMITPFASNQAHSRFTHIHTIASVMTSQYVKNRMLKRDYA